MMAVGKLNYTFSVDGVNYMADIIHYEYLSAEEIEKYKITQNTFLVHLFSPVGLTSFELFIGEDLEWQTRSNIEIEIIQTIGIEIHNRSM